jgi:hypothetical protein
MRESTAALWKLVRSNDPIACVLYEDWAAREQLIELSYLVAPSTYDVHRIESVAQALREDLLGTLLLLAPTEEALAVHALEASFDALQQRTAPVVIFLLRRGAGRKAIGESPRLSALLGHQELDPEDLDTFEIELERQRFIDQVGQTPEAWLAAWREGKLPHTAANDLLHHQALLLERGRQG